MNKGIFIVGIATVGGLAGCGSAASTAAAPTVAPTTAPTAVPTATPSLIPDGPAMDARITAAFPAAEEKVQVGDPGIVVSNVVTLCTTETAGGGNAAAQYSCFITYDVKATADYNTSHYSCTATASADSSGMYQWQVTPGTINLVGASAP